MNKSPAKFLRDGVELLALPFRNLINLSIKLSNFPETCKIANLLPVVQKKKKEKSIEDYFNKKQIINMHPSGFRRNHSTGFCLGQTLIDFVLTGTDKQIPNDMILVDLKKAFDT